jgi:hypothetical protein
VTFWIDILGVNSEGKSGDFVGRKNEHQNVNNQNEQLFTILGCSQFSLYQFTNKHQYKINEIRERSF